jgi:hypothetical protein
VNAAVIEEGRAVPVDEIDVARDLAAVEEAAALLRAERVLPAEEAAVAKRRAIPGDVNRQSLPVIAGGVFEGDVLGGEVVALKYDRRGIGRREFSTLRIDSEDVLVVGDDGPGGVGALEGDERLIGGDNEMALVGARRDFDDECLGRVGWRGVDGRLERLVAGCIVRRDGRAGAKLRKRCDGHSDSNEKSR